MIEDIPLPHIDQFPIEAGHIKIFARAIGDPNPIYSDAAYAGETPLGGIIAPPTFLEAGIHFDSTFPFRPRLGEPWLGSAAGPTGLAADARGDGTDMHAEAHFEYHRLIRPGMVLHARTQRGDTWKAVGRRAGQLRFAESTIEYYDERETLVATNRTVIVSTQHKVETPAVRLDAEASESKHRLDLPSSYPVPPLHAQKMSVGMRRQSAVTVNLSRVQIIQYAGATGDFSPQHVDEVYSTQVAGYPSVFGHGMLTMAMVGRMLTDWVGDGALTKFGFQFRRQIWPGDTVVATGTISAITISDGPEIAINVEATSQHQEVIGTGYATARVPL